MFNHRLGSQGQINTFVHRGYYNINPFTARMSLENDH